MERIPPAIAMASVTLAAVTSGGAPFTLLLMCVCAVAALEWLQLCGLSHGRLSALEGLAVLAMFSESVTRLHAQDASTVIWLLFTVWATDTGALCCGRLLGGPQLPAFISANKTWAGALGGVVCGSAAGSLLWQPVPSLLLATAALAGDLVESRCKRIASLKDSNLRGLAIPGHGGVLDRIDGLLAAAPLAAWLRLN
jgi:phosphatidate cytidylyltransferase